MIKVDLQLSHCILVYLHAVLLIIVQKTSCVLIGIHVEVKIPCNLKC